MDVKTVFLIVCLCALAITSTEAGIPRCCMTANRKLRPHLVKKIVRWELQENNGVCDIRALVVFVKGSEKPLCFNPNLKPSQAWFMKKKKRFS